MANPNPNPAMDPSSPYFVHPSEAPGTSLVPTVLTGKNYHTWARLMKMALKGKNKLQFVDGRIRKPEVEDPLFLA